jgi:hypothetical protein
VENILALSEFIICHGIFLAKLGEAWRHESIFNADTAVDLNDIIISVCNWGSIWESTALRISHFIVTEFLE